MTDELRHRGPDDSGLSAHDGVALGMRRLSIIDLAGGHQPITNESGSVEVVQNGEIYNFQTLRLTLANSGHRFRTNSDTEIIAHLYEQKGIDGIEDLRGMFALAIWDNSKQRLVVARDRLGKKPLYYAWRNGVLLYASEIKALLAADPGLKEIDPEALPIYFEFGFVPEPRTIYRHIHKLPAAHVLVWEQDAIRLTRYWHFSFDQVDMTKSTGQWIEELDHHLAESVRMRLISDVPVGVLLSGGIDSSAIAAYARRSAGSLSTFTIAFDRPEWDESSDAAIVARHLETDHHVLHLTESSMSQHLGETVRTLVRHFDEPFGDSSALPTFFVAKLAREHVKVVLTGDGGDELFAGYTSYQGMKLAEYFRRIPRFLRPKEIFSAPPRWLPQGLRYKANRVAKLISDSNVGPLESYLRKVAITTPSLRSSLLVGNRNGALDVLPPDVRDAFQSNWPIVHKVSYADIRFRLLEDMLVKMDRMTMAHSLEARSPFLDHRLVEFIATMPANLKLHRLERKAILKRTIRPYLPSRPFQKRKQGFSVPLREWFRGALAPTVQEMIVDNESSFDGAFNRSVIKTIADEHQKGYRDHSQVLWLLLIYAVWHEQYA